MTADLDRTHPATQWQRFCDLLWHDPGLQIWLDVSRMNLSSADLEALAPRFDAAFAAMAALERGAIANPDEQRQVGHYWLRNPSLAPDPAITAHIKAEVERMEQFAAEQLASTRFTDVLWIGIGGSGLGPLLMPAGSWFRSAVPLLRQRRSGRHPPHPGLPG